jgi:hypothetical protein
MIISDLMDLQTRMGIENMQEPAEGMRCGVLPMPFAAKVTEIIALQQLFECEVHHIMSGGVGGAEGSVSLLIESYDKTEFDEIESFMKLIGNEPIYQPNK